MTRAEIWLGQVGQKTRPVLILTRPEVIEVRALVTVAEVSRSIRGLSSEVAFDYEHAGLKRPSVINCDGLHTVAQSSLTELIGRVDDRTMSKVCWAVSYALSC